jgi:2,4-dienoyl-CoA reductase-like NADH-dependent reductase (Old Yellow Enzyme family)
MNEGRYREAAKLLKQLTPTSVVVSQGNIRTPLQAENILREDGIDLIGIAQAAIADPKWPQKALAGSDSIVSCTECGRCRYIKRNDLSFDCVRPETYHPINSKYKR